MQRLIAYIRGFRPRQKALLCALVITAIALPAYAYKEFVHDLRVTGDLEVVGTTTLTGGITLPANNITYADISDSSALDADTTFTAADGIDFTWAPTHTSGDTNFWTIDANQTDDAAATDDFDALRLDLTSESGDAGDTFDGLVVIWEEGTANTIMDSAIKIDNAETTASTMTDAILVTSSGVNLGVTDGLDVSAANLANAVNIGANPIVTGNVAGTIGDATTDSWTLTTDGTGDAEIQLPANSISASELTDDTVDGTELADTITLDAALGITSGAGEGIAMTHAMTANAIETAYLITVTADDNGASTTEQFVMYLDAAPSSESVDALLVIDNSDTDDVVLDGILFRDAGGGFTDAIDTGGANINAGTGTLIADALDSSGATALTFGSADTTDFNVNSDVGITFANNSESLNNLVDATFDFGRDTAGIVILTASDDDAVAALTILPGGAEALVLGGASTTSTTLTTDGTQDAEVQLPENSIGPDEIAGVPSSFVGCGDLANAGTLYGGPIADSFDGTGGEYALAGTACSANDNSTEATTDESIAANTAFKITGMYCVVSGSGSNGVVLTARSAEADLTPSLTCTVGTGNTTCSTVLGTTTDVAAGATVAIKSVTSGEDLSAQDFWCRVGVIYK